MSGSIAWNYTKFHVWHTYYKKKLLLHFSAYQSRGGAAMLHFTQIFGYLKSLIYPGCIAWNYIRLNISSPYCKKVILHIFGTNRCTDGATILHFLQISGYLYLLYFWLWDIEFIEFTCSHLIYTHKLISLLSW